jgi:DNA-binding NarL/FixJ family response regulator
MSGQAGTKLIRVMLVEDHLDFKALMEALLGSQPDFKIVAQAGSLAEAGAQVAKFGFDLVVLDLQQRSKALTRLGSWSRLAAIRFWQDEYCMLVRSF